MDKSFNRKFYVDGVGVLYKKSLEMFADKLLDTQGVEITVDDIEPDQKLIAVFKSGTGDTRTIVNRIA
ncbi:MAG: hypothetical protein ACLFRF_07775 [Desulfobacterales bacterium]